MPGHKYAHAMHNAPLEAKDPGSGGTITVERTPYHVALVSAGAENRTLARPTRAGEKCVLYFRTDGGDITLTVTGGYDLDGNTTITFADAGQTAAFESFYTGSAYAWRLVYSDAAGGGARKAEILTALATLTAADHDKTFFLNLAAGFAVTLPAPALGLRFRFRIMLAPSGGSYTVVTASSAQVLGGIVVTAQDAGGSSDSESPLAGTTITFVDAKSVAGDSALVESDGTSWHVDAIAKVFDGITITG